METRRRYDLDKLRADLRASVADLQKLKEELHTYAVLRELKLRVTKLCCLRANHRGRVHMRDREKNDLFVAETEPGYLLKAADVAA
jgi:hypothetical protein